MSIQALYLGELALISSGYLVYENHVIPRVILPQTLLNIGTNPPNSPLYIRRSNEDLPLIAPQHCSIFFDPKYKCFAIKDSFSDYGTWVNSQALDPQHAVLLHNGDEIQLGDPLLEGGALLKFYFSISEGPITETIKEVPFPELKD